MEQAEQLVRILGDDVLGLGVQRVREGYGKGHVLALVRKVAGRFGSLARVLVRLEVVDDRVGVRRRLLLWTGQVCPRGWRFVLPLLNHPVTRVSQGLGSYQGEIVRGLPCQGLALAVPPYNQLTLFVQPCHSSTAFFGVALRATVPEAAVVLEDGLRLGVITINPSAQNLPLTPMATTSVVDVDAPLPHLPLEPFDCDETATGLGVEGFLVGRWWELDAAVRADDLGLPASAAGRCVPQQIVSPGESRLTTPTSVGTGNLGWGLN